MEVTATPTAPGLVLTDALRAILRAIHDRPDDDTPRGAFADELEDVAGDLPDPDGARAWAEFIRVQCELARVTCDRCNPDGTLKRGFVLESVHIRAGDDCVFCKRRGLHRRANRLWGNAVECKAAFGWIPEPSWVVRRFLDDASPIVFLQLPGDRQNARLDVLRGFPSRGRLLTEHWLAHGDEARPAFPINHVRLTGQHPTLQGQYRRDLGCWGLRLEGREKWHAEAAVRAECERLGVAVPGEDYDLLPGLLSLEWPGITFELAPRPVNYRVLAYIRMPDGRLYWEGDVLPAPRVGDVVRLIDGTEGVLMGDVLADGTAPVRPR